MRIMLMTDLEGVAGVKNAPQWCQVDSQFYGVACRLLTMEVNAAVDGFFSGGAKYVMVADGHGAGAIDIELLDARVEYARGWPPDNPWPFGLDASFNGVAWVGQHAKASSEYAHLCHTQSFRYINLSVNGVSIGEFGQLALCGAELGVPAFFGAGDLAFTQEAEALAPGIVTCAIKRGVTPGKGEDCTTDEYRDRNAGAVHTPPERARAMIRKAAEAAAWKLKKNPPVLIPLRPPFERVAILRPEKRGEPKVIARETHPSSAIDLMGLPMDFKPMT